MSCRDVLQVYRGRRDSSYVQYEYSCSSVLFLLIGLLFPDGPQQSSRLLRRPQLTSWWEGFPRFQEDGVLEGRLMIRRVEFL